MNKSNKIKDLNDIELLIDRNFRLYREELIDEMIEKKDSKNKPINLLK